MPQSAPSKYQIALPNLLYTELLPDKFFGYNWNYKRYCARGKSILTPSLHAASSTNSLLRVECGKCKREDHVAKLADAAVSGARLYDIT